MTTTRPARILILGGGFGGVHTALNLEKILKRELTRGEVESALVSRDNYLTFQRMLPEVVSGSIGILDTITPIRRLCPRTNLYTRAIEGSTSSVATSPSPPAWARANSSSNTIIS